MISGLQKSLYFTINGNKRNNSLSCIPDFFSCKYSVYTDEWN